MCGEVVKKHEVLDHLFFNCKIFGEKKSWSFVSHWLRSDTGLNQCLSRSIFFDLVALEDFSKQNKTKHAFNYSTHLAFKCMSYFERKKFKNFPA